MRTLSLLQERLKASSPGPNRRAKSKTKSWKVANVEADVLDVVRSGTVAPSQTPNYNSEDVHQQVMVAKGIWQCLGSLPRAILKTRLRCGFLNKRSKGAIKYFSRRWFILFVPTPFVPTAEDDLYVPETQLPNWMRHNHIYYFNFTSPDDSSACLGEIPTALCTVRIKDMSKSKDPGFSFYLDVGNRKFMLNTEDEGELKRWVECIEASKRIAQGIQSSVTGKPRNLTVSIELFDSHGPSALKGKINDTIKNLTASALKDQAEVSELLSICDELTKELVETIDGCLTSVPQRIDIATLYAETFHKKLSEILARAWATHAAKMTQGDLLMLIKWVMEYDGKLRQVGITDDKLKNGVGVLRKTYTGRLHKQAISTILEAFLALKDMEIATEGVCSSNLPALIFSTFQPTLEEQYLLFDDIFHAELIEVAWNIILQSLNGIRELLERKEAFSIDVLISLCNDSRSLHRLVVDFNRSNASQQLPEMYEEAVDLLHEIAKSYSKTVVAVLLQPVKATFQLPFHEISLETEFEKIQEKLERVERRIDPELVSKVWYDILVKIVELYTDCILHGGSSLKAQSVPLI